MSNIIENVARGAKDSLTGGDSAEISAAQDQRGGDLVKQLATGGLAVGAGASAVVALINYMKSLKDENELEDESRMNDDTLYIPEIQATKEREKLAAEGGGVNRWLAPGLAMTGGILSAGGAYALTQAVYNYVEKKRRQSMLDEAQGEALAAADLETTKSAADTKMNFYDLATAFPVAIPLLAAMASGGVAYAALSKTFPTVRAPKSKFPKRIRQVSQTGKVDDYAGEDEVLKAASLQSLRADADCEDAALEFLMMVTDQMSIEKKAEHTLTSDIINSVAKNGLEVTTATYQDAGLEGLLEVVKGASHKPADTPNKVLASAALCKSARLRPIMATLAAAEFQEMAPAVLDMAISHGESHMDKMAGVASLMHIAFFRPQMLDKSASTNPLMEELQNLINVPGMEPAPQVDPGMDPGMDQEMQALTSDVPGVMEADNAEIIADELNSDAHGNLAEGSAEGETAEEMGSVGEENIDDHSDDVVDTFMDMEGKSPLLTPENDGEDTDMLG